MNYFGRLLDVLVVFCFVFGEAQSSNDTSAVGSTPSTTLASQPSTSSRHMGPSAAQSTVSASTSSISGIRSSTVLIRGKTTASPGGDKLETYVIVIIATCVAVFLILIIILLLFCVCRRRRIQKLERERNLSYNNMNYESTVKFRLSENGEQSTPDSEENKPPEKNRQHQVGEYEVVNLPKDSNSPRREYENVVPQQADTSKKAPEPRRSYENVKPLSMAQKESSQTKPPYEEVALTTPTKTDDMKKKYYENVEA